MNDDIPPYVVEAWRRTIPDVTDVEIATLLPVVQMGRLRAIIVAYRAGVLAGTQMPEPLAGFVPCPTCLSVRVSSVSFDLGRMVARCRDCATLFYAADGTLIPAGHSADVPAPPDAPAPAVPLRSRP